MKRARRLPVPYITAHDVRYHMGETPVCRVEGVIIIKKETIRCRWSVVIARPRGKK
jgi:hypothetical protein